MPPAKVDPTFTDRQRRLIDKAKAAGYGYFLFACSVEKQGRCSPKQEEALYNMLNAYEFRKNNWRGKRSSNPYSNDISDNEAMRSGDFF